MSFNVLELNPGVPPISRAAPASKRTLATAKRIRGTGEMADLIRAHHWEETPLGAVEDWSSELTTSVNMMLSSKLVSCLVWGPERILLYNDLYRPFLGGKTLSLGEPFLKVWAELHEQADILTAEPWDTEESNLVERVTFRILVHGEYVQRVCSLTNNPIWVGTHEGPRIVGLYQTILDHTNAETAEAGLEVSQLHLKDSQSEQLRANRALHQSEQRLRALVSASSDAVYQMNPDWSEMRQMEGQDSHLLFLAETTRPNANWLDVYIYPDDQERVRKAIDAAILSKKLFELEHRVVQEDGRTGWTHSRAVPLLDAQGAIQEWFGMAVDISDRKAAEAALLQSEKLAVVGRLASTIAHEINNPLDAVRNILWLVQNEESLPRPVYEYLKLADEELTRIFHLARQTLSFSRRATSSRILKLGDLAESMLAIFAPRIRNKNVTVLKEIDYENCVVGVEADLLQIMTNLLGNSLDALPTSGAKLWVRVRPARWEAKRGTRLTIADNGVGIPITARSEVFQPFASHKEDYGTGLGLWIVKELVTKHGGSIQWRSSSVPGHSWTVFSILLPEVPPTPGEGTEMRKSGVAG